jgi:hypothetical protein
METSRTITKVSVFATASLLAFLSVGAFFASAEAAPNVNATIRNASEAVVTSALIGANVHSVVQIASSTTSVVPQGTVDFNVYGNTSCTGTATTQSNVALLNGFATSSATAITASGLSYKVHYDGDINNVSADSTCMPLTAQSNSASINTTLSSSTITAGQSVLDTATLSGITSNATGTVNYTIFSNASCTTPFGGAGNVSVTNGVVPNSSSFQFITPGTYYWQAVYSGDMNNNAATSTCANGILTVQAVAGKNSPTISTTLSTSSILTGTIVHDSATLVGETSNATGTVVYKIFTDTACTNLYANAGSKTVANGIVPDSDNIQFNSAGTYYWQAVYSGDMNNNAATSTCTTEILTVSAQVTIPPTAGAGTISGVVFNDKNKNEVRDSGEEGLAGFTINLYDSANFNGGKYDPVFKVTTTDANGAYMFTGLINGTYSVEQLLKKGWKQTSADFASVAITGSAGVSGLNFGDIAKHGSGDNCKNKEKRGKGNHKRDCSDDNSSPKSWWRNGHDNGLHLGWTKEKNKSKKHKDD